jgi:Xaa-Pro aminopeptidase
VHAHTPIHQDPLFLYLTGINQPGCVLYCDAETDYLFLPTKDPSYEFWEGTRLGCNNPADAASLRAYSGIAHVLDIASLRAWIRDHSSTVGCHWHASDNSITDYLWDFKTDLAAQCPELMITNIQEALWPERFVLDSVDQGDFAHAYQATHTAFANIQALWDTFTSETELTGALIGELLKTTPYGLSFPPIVANGANATTLHYSANNASLDPNALVLLDFGLRWRGMCSDVSRTVPVSGTMNPLQTRLHSIVETVKTSTTALVKPGVTLDALNTHCWGAMQHAIQTEIIDHGGTVTQNYDQRPHNVGHLIGYTVHDGDPLRNYKNKPLSSGMAITIEPGFYGHVRMNLNGIIYEETLGIRLEDAVVI